MICRVPIRVSYFVVAYFGFNVLIAFGQYANSGWKMLLFGVSSAFMQCILLYLTVLVHEFGHGTMSRYLGGEIDHILLWPFGGICFSSRPEERDPRLLVKNDFKVVAAGPTTHIPQTTVWVFVAILIAIIVNTTSVCSDVITYGLTYQDGGWYEDPTKPYKGCFPCEGLGCFMVFLNPFRPMYAPVLQATSLGLYFLFYIPLMAIQLNLLLFAFNVFFPMYPADGAKLLTSSLMHCCGVRPYKAAGVLIWTSGICAILLIAWSVYSFEKGIGNAFGSAFHGGSGAGTSGMAAFSGLLPGFLGLMALQETWTIYNLRLNNRLSEHQYFRVARTDITQARDQHGRIATLNVTGRDNPNQAFGNNSGVEDSRGCCCLPCWPPSRAVGEARSEIEPANVAAPVDAEAAQRTRQDRAAFLENLQARQQH